MEIDSDGRTKNNVQSVFLLQNMFPLRFWAKQIWVLYTYYCPVTHVTQMVLYLNQNVIL